MRFESDLFQNSFNRSFDDRSRKKTMEEELAQKRQLMQEQAGYENQSLSPEEKLFRLSQQNPGGFQKFMEMKNSMSPYQEAMLGIQRGQLGIQGAKLGQENITPQQKNFQFIKTQFPDLPDEQILQMLIPGAKKKTGFSFSD